MAATPLAPTSRYYRPGVTKIYFVEEIADISAPTRTELDAGTDLSGEVAEIEGFQVVSDTVDTPDFGSRFTGKVPGAITADDSALIFYADRTSNDIRALLPRDTEGYFVFMDEGDTEDHLMDIYPGTVRSVPKLRTRDDPARLQVQVAITAEPAENVAIPGTP